MCLPQGREHLLQPVGEGLPFPILRKVGRPEYVPVGSTAAHSVSEAWEKILSQWLGKWKGGDLRISRRKVKNILGEGRFMPVVSAAELSEAWSLEK